MKRTSIWTRIHIRKGMIKNLHFAQFLVPLGSHITIVSALTENYPFLGNEGKQWKRVKDGDGTRLGLG